VLVRAYPEMPEINAEGRSFDPRLVDDALRRAERDLVEQAEGQGRILGRRPRVQIAVVDPAAAILKGARGEDPRRRGQPRAGPAKAYEIGQRLDDGTQGGPRTGPHVPSRGDLTGVGPTPTLAMPLKRNVRRESRCRRHSMHASGGEVGVLFRRVAGGLIRPRSSRGRGRA
jgi:hypothetical protein